MQRGQIKNIARKFPHLISEKIQKLSGDRNERNLKRKCTSINLGVLQVRNKHKLVLPLKRRSKNHFISHLDKSS